MRIVCDVDMVVCAIDLSWLNWLNSLFGTALTLHDFEDENGVINYAFGDYFSQFKDPYPRFNALDFYRAEGIYDVARVVPKSQFVLANLYEEGHEIVFASHCKGNHHKSKYYSKFPVYVWISCNKRKMVNQRRCDD